MRWMRLFTFTPFTTRADTGHEKDIRDATRAFFLTVAITDEYGYRYHSRGYERCGNVSNTLGVSRSMHQMFLTLKRNTVMKAKRRMPIKMVYLRTYRRRLPSQPRLAMYLYFHTQWLIIVSWLFFPGLYQPVHSLALRMGRCCLLASQSWCAILGIGNNGTDPSIVLEIFYANRWLLERMEIPMASKKMLST